MTLTLERAAAETSVQSGGYASLLVHVEPGVTSAHRVEAAACLARDLGARLIGLGAEALEPFPAPDPIMGYAAGEWVVLMQEQVNNDLAAAETSFRRDAAGAELEWRSVQAYPTQAMAHVARSADLLVVSPPSRAGLTHSVDPAGLVMTAGRPVLIVPPAEHRLHGKAVVVAWKDTRESRRAIADALPLLRRAEDVVIHAICKAADDEDARFEAEDVAAALKRHGVAARAVVSHGNDEQVTAALRREADLIGADLIVAGGFGHSRAREWVLGGVTDDFLNAPDRFILLSH